ncbi:hypothetical protein RclHR1_09140006 [Rhizophagus clarus]|uniref:Uncharacterized protein n=1 Tax=Rhizophagus clarus TaxID=94130 RepID=A0A2Z6QFT5_9GLOM|nr:hypothetical protein RclHR1_11190002 [Rhizophagus clarus]GBB96100.1 hypothetical protein RclHR1_26810002 [Rhizophagus clarus]GBC06047.1 hypothetical protein RclHR1_00660001 [Rhizophagus clarus]GBC09826.1 hypothetical protein RclHR1_09140006 [Rhizophagus clarus]GES80128.1 hypothetical protein RCL_e14038_RclHR1_11190002 [Rhizophagus clarus]
MIDRAGLRGSSSFSSRAPLPARLDSSSSTTGSSFFKLAREPSSHFKHGSAWLSLKSSRAGSAHAEL